MTHERVSRPLGRIAELLVENHAKVSLNEIRDLLEVLDARAYLEGFEDGQITGEDRSGRMIVGPMTFGPVAERILMWIHGTSNPPDKVHNASSNQAPPRTGGIRSPESGARSERRGSSSATLGLQI
jgi:hypothetical protein